MKVSIITPSFNSAETLEDTIKSVLTQNYSEIEYILIDGGSTDETLEIISRYENKISKFISEKDTGIYNAMNKGLALATGDIVGILNSDDIYSSEEVILTIVKEIQEKRVDCVWGDLVYVNKENKVIRRWQSSEYENGAFQKGWHPPHPTFFVKKDIYKKYRMFNESLSIAADYELMLRFLEKYKIKSSYISQELVKMRIGGKSNKNILNIARANYECYKAWRINKLRVNPLNLLMKPISKVKQYF